MEKKGVVLVVMMLSLDLSAPLQSCKWWYSVDEYLLAAVTV